jgi:hypothetical protein
MKYLLTLISIFFVSACLPTTAQIDCSAWNQETLTISGSMPQFFNECITVEKNDTVFINSGGGSVQSAIEISQYFKEQNVTVVAQQCASSCTIILTNANQRYGCTRGFRFGIHQGSGSYMVNDMILAQITDERVNQEHYRNILINTSNEDIFYINYYESIQNGYIDEAAYCRFNRYDEFIDYQLMS